MINDPGNAGTANGDDNILARAFDRNTKADRSRRVMALVMALVSGLVLLPSVLVTLFTGEWRWLLAGLGGWLSLAMVASGITTYLYGPRR